MILERATLSGSVASLSSALTLAACATAEGRKAVQPLNATSHWLHGDAAAYSREADLARTGAGYVTHHAATVLWACLFEYLRQRSGRADAAAIMRDAAATAAIAAIVDYTITPKRLTPGWELVLSKRAMALGYAGLAAGLAATALLRRRHRAAHASARRAGR